MSHMGRPKIDNPKGTQISVRLDDATLRKLDACAKSNGETRAQTLRRGIEKLFSDMKK